MDDFEGTIVLEKLAEIGLLDEFYAAIDSDNFVKVKSILMKANFDNKTIHTVMSKMNDADGEH